MDKNTKIFLEKAGWFEGREIDIQSEVALIKSWGFEVFDAAIDFLKEFADLKIIAKYEFRGREKSVEHNTCLSKVATEGLDKEFNNLDKYTSEKVVPVGYIHNGEKVLYITESGKIVTDAGIEGNNSLEAWDNIIGRKKGEAWPCYQKEVSENFKSVMERLRNGEVIK